MAQITNKDIYNTLTEVKVSQEGMKKDIELLSKTATTNSQNLKEHIKRTNLLEEKINALENPWIWAIRHPKQALFLVALAGIFVLLIEDIKEYIYLIIKSSL